MPSSIVAISTCSQESTLSILITTVPATQPCVLFYGESGIFKCVDYYVGSRFLVVLLASLSGAEWFIRCVITASI